MSSSRLKKRGSGRTTGGSRNEDGCRWTKVGRSSLDLVSSPLQDSSDTGHWQGALRFLSNTRVGQGAGMRVGQWAADNLKGLIDGSGSMMVKAVSAGVQELLLERACQMTAASMRTNWPSRWHSHFRWERRHHLWKQPERGSTLAVFVLRQCRRHRAMSPSHRWRVRLKVSKP